MILGNDAERAKIQETYDRFKQSKDYFLLNKLGITVFRDECEADCVAEMCGNLGFPARPETLDILLKYGQQINEPENGCLVLYYDNSEGKAQFKHAGLYNTTKVVSRWDNYFVMLHAYKDIPSMFGDEAKFIRVTPEVLREIQLMVMGMDIFFY
jgi:hypothetical protein